MSWPRSQIALLAALPVLALLGYALGSAGATPSFALGLGFVSDAWADARHVGHYLRLQLAWVELRLLPFDGAFLGSLWRALWVCVPLGLAVALGPGLRERSLRGPMLGLFALGLGARLAAGFVNITGYSKLVSPPSAVSPGFTKGALPEHLPLALLFHDLAPPGWVLELTQITLGALLPVAAAMLLLRASAPRGPAWATGLLLALAPFAVRSSASDAAQILPWALGAAAALAFLESTLSRSPLRLAALFVLTLGATAQRQELVLAAIAPLLWIPVAMGLSDSERKLRGRFPISESATLLSAWACGLLLVTLRPPGGQSEAMLLSVGNLARWGLSILSFEVYEPPYALTESSFVAPLGLAALLLPLRERRWRTSLWRVAALLIAAAPLVVLRDFEGFPNRTHEIRYALPAWTTIHLLMVCAIFELPALFARWPRWQPRIAPLLLGGIVLLGLPRYGALRVQQRELRFLKTQLAALPADCEVVAAFTPASGIVDGLGLHLPHSLLAHHFPNQRWHVLRDPGDVESLAFEGRCAVFFESALCQLPSYEAILENLKQEPLADAAPVAARATWAIARSCQAMQPRLDVEIAREPVTLEGDFGPLAEGSQVTLRLHRVK